MIKAFIYYGGPIPTGVVQHGDGKGCNFSISIETVKNRRAAARKWENEITIKLLLPPQMHKFKKGIFGINVIQKVPLTSSSTYLT